MRISASCLSGSEPPAENPSRSQRGTHSIPGLLWGPAGYSSLGPFSRSAPPLRSRPFRGPSQLERGRAMENQQNLRR